MPIYMKVPGATGSVTTGEFKGWIPLTGFQLGVDRGKAMEKGNMAIVAGSSPRLTPFTVMKNFEDASVPLMDRSLGNPPAQFKLEVAVTSEDGGGKYLLYELEKALVTSYDVSSSGNEPLEIIGFSYEVITATFTPHDKSHTSETNLQSSYNLETGG